MSDVSSARKAKKDLYANKAYGLVTMSAANTLTFGQIQMGVGLFQGIALVIHRVLWYPSWGTLKEIVAATDILSFALTTSNRLTGLVDISDPAIITRKAIAAIGVGTEPYHLPIISDFTTLPGGGKLVPANPLWIGCTSSGFAAAGEMRAELEFTFVELADREYLELIQTMFPANIT